jgi:hypothetical protein
MLNAVSRYGARVLPNTQQIIAACKARGEFIQGPQIAEFERAFEKRPTDLFPGPHTDVPGATRSEDAIQVPVYAALTDAQVARIAGSVRRAAIDIARKVGSAPADTAART